MNDDQRAAEIQMMIDIFEKAAKDFDICPINQIEAILFLLFLKGPFDKVEQRKWINNARKRFEKAMRKARNKKRG